MRTSPETDQISAAVSKMQGELKPAVKDSVNPFFKSNFTSFTVGVESARPILAKYGLCVNQTGRFLDNGQWVLVTRMSHTSGQWMEGDWPVLSKDQTAQGFGSGSSYSKRYSFNAMVGIVTQEDDDAEAAMGRYHEPKKEIPKQTAQQYHKPTQAASSKTHVPKPTSPPQNSTLTKISPPTVVSGASNTPQSDLATEPQMKRLDKITEESGWTKKEVSDLVFSHYKKDSPRLLTKNEYQIICNWIQTTPPPQAGMMEQF